MQNATVLFCADLDTPEDVLRQAAEAARARNQHLAVLVYGLLPTPPIAAMGALPYGSLSIPDDWQDTLNAAHAEIRARVEALEALVAQAGASADIRPLFAPVSDIRDGVAASALTADFARVAPNLRDDSLVFAEMLHGVIMNSPIGAILNDAATTRFDRVTLAWNGSLQSARAAHQALPILKEASEVHLVLIDPPALGAEGEREPGREAAAWLSHQGCTVTLTQKPSGGKEVGACILDHAEETGSGLIVSGAYGHSRLRQAMFGGTSRTLIEQTDMPVFLAH